MRTQTWIAAAGLALAIPFSAQAGKELINLSAAEGEEILVSQTTRRIPGAAPRTAPPSAVPGKPGEPAEIDSGAVPPPPPNLPREFIPIPDRWRLIEAIGVNAKWWDPYNQNVLKADRPIASPDWFINLAAISDTVLEPRRVPTPIADQASQRPGSIDQFGN